MLESKVQGGSESLRQGAVKRVLIVEDEPDIAELLSLHLSDLGVSCRQVGDGLQALQLAQSEHWDLLMLDIRLPGIDGLEVCRRLRNAGATVPILLLTAKSAELDRVLGLEVGADDYVTKPFSVMEVMARVRAIFRRVALDQGRAAEPAEMALGNLHICTTRRQVQVGDQTIELTPREFDLLAFFAASPGTVYRRAQLLDQVWGYGHDGYEHTVNSHINRLRRKLQQNPSDPDYIVTVWGVGYKFNDSLESEYVA